MSDLIKQIDHELDAWPRTSTLCKTLRDCKAEIKRLSKPYVPMDAHDWMLTMEDDYCFSYERAQKVETAVIARYNEQRGVK